MQVSAGIISHEDFHRMSWLCSLEKPGWYYSMKREHGNTIANKNFLLSIDEPLKELIQFLHRKNIYTTPSCSGHNKSEKEFEKIYSALEEDKEKINQKGLWLQDIETGARFLFQNINYKLPCSKNEFVLRIMRQQEKGIIGLHLEKENFIKEKILSLKFQGAHVYERDDLVFIQTQKSILWNDITAAVKKIILDDVHEPQRDIANYDWRAR